MTTRLHCRFFGATAKKHGPVALIHVDAHSDTNDSMFGERITHGTIFRRAIEENLVQADKMFQIGLRTTGYSAEDFDWARNQGRTGRSSRRMLAQIAESTDDRDSRCYRHGNTGLSFF